MNKKGDGCSLFDTSALAWAFLKAHKSDATTNTITGAQCMNTCTGQCAKATTLCAAGQTVNPRKKYKNYSCALFTGVIPQHMRRVVKFYEGQIKAACCDTANNNNKPACVPDSTPAADTSTTAAPTTASPTTTTAAAAAATTAADAVATDISSFSSLCFSWFSMSAFFLVF